MIVNPLIKTVFPNGAKIIFSLINFTIKFSGVTIITC